MCCRFDGVYPDISGALSTFFFYKNFRYCRYYFGLNEITPMKKLPKWFWIESSVIIIFLFIIFIISEVISIVPWKEKYRYCGFFILSGISLVIWLISFIYIKKKKNNI